MKEQFDKKLVEKIKDSFQNHEEPFNPQEWEKLIHAYIHPVKKKKFVFWPFLVSGIAASILLVLVFWPIGEELQKNVQTLTDSIAIENKQFEKTDLPKDKEGENLAILGEKTLDEGIKSNISSSTPVPKPELAQREAILSINNIFQGSPEKPSLSHMSKGLENSMKIRQDIKENAANEDIGDLIMAKNEDAKKAQQWIDEWKGDGQSENTLKTVKTDDSGADGNNMRLGVLVGPQSSSNPLEGMSLGAGVMSEFSFSKRIKLDVGVTYARHSMVPERGNSLPQNEMLSSLSGRSGFIGSNAELNFSGLDIPVNLKYKVMDKDNSGLYLISGLSSMIYLNQQTSETFAMNSYFTTSTEGVLDFKHSVQEFTHEAGPEGRSDGVDLGRMLNLSVGYEYNLKNGTYLSIEPYYKLPLGDMTFANQQFSIGGINLRMNFRIGK